MFVAIMSNAVDVGQEFERAKLRPYRFATISIVRSLASVGFGLLGIWLGWGGMGLLAAFGLGSLSVIILNLVGDRTKIARFQRSQFMQLARYGLPLTLAVFRSRCTLPAIVSSSPGLLGKDAAGIFGVAADLSAPVHGDDRLERRRGDRPARVPIGCRRRARDATRERLSESFELLLVVVAPVAVWPCARGGPGRRHARRHRFPRRRVGAAADFGARPASSGSPTRFYVQISFQLAERPFMLEAPIVPHPGRERGIDVRAGGRLRPLTVRRSRRLRRGDWLVVAVVLMHRAHPVPFDFNRLAGRRRVGRSDGGRDPHCTHRRSDGTALVSLIVVSVAGGLAYAAAAWLLNVAKVRYAVAALPTDVQPQGAGRLGRFPPYPNAPR